MAYWEIQKTPQIGRWLTSTPATLRDLYDIMLTEKGKPPRSLFESSKKSSFAASDRRAWQNKTGSTQDAIDWWSKG